jgi:hypothetical protein
LHVVKFRALDRDTKQPLGPEEEVKLVRKLYEWENSSLGISDKPPHPWTPMTVAGDAVRCWGREYRFTGLGLPKSIPTLQPEPSRGATVRDVLAAREIADCTASGGDAAAASPAKSEICNLKSEMWPAQTTSSTAR